MQVVADTFPTLSGAPKHRAMQLIEEYEKTNRNFLWVPWVSWTLKGILTMPL
jgi:anthranilate/para-aminobenzoate synthase component I